MRTITTKTIAGLVTAAGAIVSGSEFAVQKTGTGSYTVTFPPGFKRISFVGNIAGGSGVVTLFVASTTPTSVLLQALTTAGALGDAGFSFAATGVHLA